MNFFLSFFREIIWGSLFCFKLTAGIQELTLPSFISFCMEMLYNIHLVTILYCCNTFLK